MVLLGYPVVRLHLHKPSRLLLLIVRHFASETVQIKSLHTIQVTMVEDVLVTHHPLWRLSIMILDRNSKSYYLSWTFANLHSYFFDVNNPCGGGNAQPTSTTSSAVSEPTPGSCVDPLPCQGGFQCQYSSLKAETTLTIRRF